MPQPQGSGQESPLVLPGVQPAGAASSAAAKKRAAAPVSRWRETLVLSLIPWLVFALILACYFAPPDYGSILRWIVAIAFLVIGSALIVAGSSCMGSHGVTLALGMLCIAAVFVGVPVGRLIIHDYMFDYWSIESGADYRNVDPSSSSASVADASVLHFEAGSVVSVEESVGYMKAGITYCVAPIAGPAGSTTPSFWAAGTDCCYARGKFDCGAVGNAEARTGIVIADPYGYHSKAVVMAASIYDMAVGDRPIFVAWSRDADAASATLWRGGAALGGGAVVVHFFASLLAGVFLARTLPKKRES
eukprot:TRINITY_DN1314_c1_g1_i1.p1 TRINITY_DN1314_c1_g1~~TRINITY_DN1314_c1_g1_i1.p1  ORF type:complete len:304 (-),score=51.65 TRINITY_DN1314_c1_g1_i1:47-958(-)